MQHRSNLLLAAPRCNTQDSWQPRVRLRRTLTTMVLATATCLPVGVQAADAKLSGFHGSPRVMMMIGGASDAGNPASPPAPRLPAERGKSSDEMDKLSVIIQPGVNTQSLAFERPSATVASRVMALAPLVNRAAVAANVDSALLMAVIDVESGGNPQAVSPKGATGLMQLMPETGARHGASNLFDPRQNIEAGARYLRQLMQQFGDLELVLAAYNAGEGAVKKYGGQIPPYAETMSYVPRVMGRYFRYRNVAPVDSETRTRTAMDAGRGRFLLVRGTTSGDD